MEQSRGLSLAQVERWVAKARHGASIVYGIGTTVSEAADPAAARWLYKQAQRGLIATVQRRVAKAGVDRFEYIAQRTAKRWEEPRPIGAGPSNMEALEREIAEVFA